MAPIRQRPSTYPSGELVGYTCDIMDRVTSVNSQSPGGSSAPAVSSTTYEPFGPYNGLTHGNGVAEARGFDQDYRLTGITDIGGSSTLQSLTYGYYPTNNVQTITNAVASSQNAGSANMSYGYGTGSDLLATLSVGGTVMQTIGYTADGRIASLNPGIQAPTGQYITSLSYNQDGRLTSVNAGAGTLASYIYDGFEQRLIKTVSGSYGEIYQYGQDGALLEETNASGVAQADYIYLNGRPVAVLNGSTLYYLHGDMLGTPQLATDSSQAVQWQTSYDAFGQASVSGTVTQNLRFPGQYFDVESGWNHNGFRDYLPSLGRYAEPDLLGRAGSGNNLYVYVGDSPTNLADPLGLCPPKKNCPATISTDPNTALLSKMIAGEATYSLNSPAEMADIGIFRYEPAGLLCTKPRNLILAFSVQQTLRSRGS
jgi:RHS repeat-associated protein